MAEVVPCEFFGFRAPILELLFAEYMNNHRIEKFYNLLVFNTQYLKCSRFNGLKLFKATTVLTTVSTREKVCIIPPRVITILVSLTFTSFNRTLVL